MENKANLVAKQLPLSIALRDDCTLDTFYPGKNDQALNQIKLMAQGNSELFVYLWGRTGAGKTHLLQGACYRAQRLGQACVYLSLADPNNTRKGPSLLEGLELVGLVCIDDLDAVAGLSVWEEALFYLYNRLRAANQRLLVAAQFPPNSLPLKLADLQSRLSWGVTYQLHLLNDEELLAALQLRAKQRGLELSSEVGGFLIRRSVRSMPVLYEMLERLDKASLAAQRRLTIPFVKTVIDL